MSYRQEVEESILLKSKFGGYSKSIKVKRAQHSTCGEIFKAPHSQLSTQGRKALRPRHKMF